MSSLLPFFPLSLYPFPISRTTPHYTRSVTHPLITYIHTTHHTHITHKSLLFPFPSFSLSLSLCVWRGCGAWCGHGCEWVCCGASVVWCGAGPPLPFFSLFLFPFFLSLGVYCVFC